MFKDLMKAYCEELIKTLNACSIEEYAKFINKWYKMGLIDKKTYSTYKKSDEKTKINSYCHLILGMKGNFITKEAKEWAELNITKPKEVC